MKHNNVLNFTSDMLFIVSNDVEKEPNLDLFLAGIEELCRDTVVRGRMQRAFVYFKVFCSYRP